MLGKYNTCEFSRLSENHANVRIRVCQYDMEKEKELPP